MPLSSTAKILVNFKRSESHCSRITAKDAFPSIKDDSRGKNLQDALSDTQSPLQFIDNAIAEIPLDNKNAINKFTQRYRELRQKWQGCEVMQSDALNEFKQLWQNIKLKHLKILQQIQSAITSGYDVQKVRESAVTQKQHAEIQHLLDPFENRVADLNKTKQDIRMLMNSLFLDIRESLPRNALNKFPVNITTGLREFGKS